MKNEEVEVRDAVTLWECVGVCVCACVCVCGVGYEAAWRDRVVARKTQGIQGLLKS